MLIFAGIIRQEFTTSDSPQFNAVAERGIALRESAGKAAAIQAGIMFPSIGVPSGDSLWAAQAYWTCHALNSTATTSNPQCMIPYEMWYSKVPLSPFPFLKPGFVKRKRSNKLKPKTVPCYYMGPSPNRPRDSVRVILRSGVMIDPCDVTLASVRSPSHVAPKPGYGEGGNISTELRP